MKLTHENSNAVTNDGEARESAQNASAFEALSGLAKSPPATELKVDQSTLIAFYLPQYHRVKENSEWWGAGFTEWYNVVRATPNYLGHYQPRLPRDLGFYDISNIEIMREQSEMARLYGIGGFCFYYYWFSGRRILEKPIDNFFRSDIDMPYCLCWANENWTRTWDGDNQSVLLRQEYRDEDPEAFIAELIPHFRDRRYIRVNDKPMLLVYRIKSVPNISRVLEIWRRTVQEAGLSGLYVVAVDFYDIASPEESGADALVEFPPHKFNGPQAVPDIMPEIINKDFSGGIIDYGKIIAQSINRPRPDFTLYRGVMPDWDNTARRQNTPTMVYGSTPELFREWLVYVRAYTRRVFDRPGSAFIFINAWNEWGEGCYLEPDQKNGFRYLEAVKASSWYDADNENLENIRQKLITVISRAIAQRYKFAAGSVCNDAEIQRDLARVGQIDSFVQKISYFLRRYHFLHRVARKIYLSGRAAMNWVRK